MLNLNYLALALLVPSALATPLQPVPRSSSLDDFVKSESSIARQGVLNNIGSNGSAVNGAASGVVVASPSKVNPDC